MEESQYLLMMWLKGKQILKSHIQAPILGACNNTTNSSSWEQRAFAENAADNMILGDECIWPPRFYSCNFCKREFRSAQALGGHMNVHRRDRAKLKQSLSPHKNEATLQSCQHKKYNSKSLDSQFSLGNCFHSQLDYCSLNSSSTLVFTTVTTSTLLSTRPSSTSTQENCFQPSIMSPYSSSISEPKENFKGLGCNDCVDTSLSVGLNSVFGQKSPTGSCDEVIISYKRPKTTSISSMPIFLKTCSKDRSMALQCEDFVLGLKPRIEDLDLELRLGEPQKVK